jgi:diguanylate cyclase (GGDEF)-like protein
MTLPLCRAMNYTVLLCTLRGICATIGIIALMLMWNAVLDLTERNDAEAFSRAQSAAVERAQTVADAMQSTIDRFDFTLNTIRQAGHSDNAQTRQSHIAVNALALQDVRIVHIDAQGYIIHSIQQNASYDSHDYVGNLDYFLRHKSRSGDSLQIGAPFLERAAPPTWILPLSRKISAQEERFAGVLALYVPLDVWQTQLRHSPQTKRDFIAVIFPDGQFILHSLNQEAVYGKRAPVDWPFLRTSTPAQGQFITRDASDNVRRLIAWNRLPNELIATAGIALDDALAPAHAISRKLRLTGTALSVLITLLTAGFISALYGIEKFLRAYDERKILHFCLADSMTEGVMEIDAENHIFRVNPAFSRITGYPASAVQDREPTILSPEHVGARNLGKLIARWIRENGDDVSEGDFDGLRASSAVNSVNSLSAHAAFAFIGHAILTARTGPTNHRIVLITDVSADRRKAEEIWHEANFDVLTRLPNDELMRDHLQLMIHHASLHSCGAAVLFTDLDYFVPISAQKGREIADRLLYEVARRLRELFHEENTVAHLKEHEDQFVVLLPDYGSASVAERAAARIVSCFSDPFIVDESGMQIKITCSVGLARLQVHGTTVEELLQYAKEAMLRAKNKGRSSWSD